MYRIMLVEDDATIVDILSRQLKNGDILSGLCRILTG